MRDYWICPVCGAHLDWGERCDCEKGDDEQSEDNTQHSMKNICSLRNGETGREREWRLMASDV